MHRRLCLLVGLAFVVFGAGANSAEPSGDQVWLTDRGSPLTHAVVKKVLADGILFVSDQGLVKVRFDQLAPEWRKNYGGDSQRVAKRERQVAQETKQILQKREETAREKAKESGPMMTIAGTVISRANGILVLSCQYVNAPEEEFPRAVGWVAIRDGELYAKTTVDGHVKVVGKKGADIAMESGQEVPCFTIAKR
jgi:hypothetical protein